MRLYARAGREVTGERERAFSISAEEPPEAQADDPRRDASGWLCDPIHCLAAPDGGGWGGEVGGRARARGGRDVGGGHGKAVLLV